MKTKFPRITVQPDLVIEIKHMEEVAKDNAGLVKSILGNFSRYEDADGLEDASDDMEMVIDNCRELTKFAKRLRSLLDAHIAEELRSGVRY